MQLSHFPRSVLFAAGLLVGVLLTLAFQAIVPRWELKLLHYQHGSHSHHRLIRVNAYTGEVEELATSVPSPK
jgi:uncharacterized membrane protein YecN with MAPEG domain